MRRLIILQVEENRADAAFLREACQAASLPADFYDVSNGADAVAYLKGEGVFAGRHARPVPDVIILDLKRPGVGGFDFLRWLRGEPAFRTLPVLVFTQSAEPADKARALAEGATGYFLKPANRELLARLTDALRRLGHPGAADGVG